jgi:hypothetical protein
VLAGYVLQTNAISASALMVAAAMALLSLVEIRASRPYKDLKRARANRAPAEAAHALHLEGILKSLSAGVIVLGAGLLAFRLWG